MLFRPYLLHPFASLGKKWTLKKRTIQRDFFLVLSLSNLLLKILGKALAA